MFRLMFACIQEVGPEKFKKGLDAFIQMLEEELEVESNV